MKNVILILMSTVALLSLTACNNTNKVYISKNVSIPTALPDYENDTITDFVVEVDVNEVKSLIETKESFALYIGNAACNSCEAFRPALIEYVYKSKSLIYHFDNLLHGTTYNELPTAYPDYFTVDYAPTPSLYFFKDGALSARREGSTRMFDYRTFQPIMGGYVAVTSINYIYSQTALNQIVDLESSTVFFYSRTNIASNNLYYNYLFPYVKTLSNAFYVVDIDALNLSTEEQATFLTEYSLDAITGEIVNYQLGIVASSIVNDDGNEQTMVDWLKALY